MPVMVRAVASVATLGLLTPSYRSDGEPSRPWDGHHLTRQYGGPQLILTRTL